MKSGKIRSEITSRDKDGKVRSHGVKERSIETGGKVKSGSVVAMAKGSTGLTIAFSYQSVRIDVGADYPYHCRPGVIDDIRPAYDELFEMLGEELMKQSPELDKVVRQLAKKYR